VISFVRMIRLTSVIMVIRVFKRVFFKIIRVIRMNRLIRGAAV
jgi:hypothetical protein